MTKTAIHQLVIREDHSVMDKHIEDIAKEIIDSAIEIHIALGPGLLESAY